MATKKNELAEQETKILEDNADSMDLNELLGSMDTDPEEDFPEESEDSL